jgi:hypothetical protein
MAILQGSLPGTTFTPPAKAAGRADFTPSTAPPGSDDLTGRAHRQLIGSVGLLLPIVIYLIAAVAPNDADAPWQLRWSISAYYYTSAVVAFIGLLVALSLYLFAYEGYRNEWHRTDKRCARIAAVAALGVAVFPTSAPPGMALPWWMEWMELVHYVSAVALFSAFAVFCFMIFTLPNPKGDNPDRILQNRIYRGCGAIIVGSMIAAFIFGTFFNVPIFWFESVMLLAFATSWLVKGKIHKTALEVMNKKN